MQGYPKEAGGYGTCRYGAEYLMRQVSAVQREIPGVLRAVDIEHIHRMRVATRRLRSALPLFPLCLPKKRIRRWRRGLRGIARALGEARDADVQIAFLKDFIDDLRAGKVAGNRAMLPAVISPGPPPVPYHRWYGLPVALRGLARIILSALSRTGAFVGLLLSRRGNQVQRGPPAERPDLVSGAECVLLRKVQARAHLQEEIGKAIQKLESSSLLGEMDRDLGRLVEGDGEGQGVWREAFASALVSVSSRIDTLLVIGEFLADPEKAREHHAMRIAVKHLRYTLEVWRDLFGRELEPEIGTLKSLQDLLGDLHDCNVWTSWLPGFLSKEEERCKDFFGNDSHFRTLVPGLEALARDRKDRSKQLHEAALTLWNDLTLRGFWDRLRAKLLLPFTVPAEGPIRIGLLGNISGDAPALSKVLADGRSRGVHLFLNAGDTLGRGRRASREVIGILRREGVVSVAGDGDLRVLEGMSITPGEDTGGTPAGRGLSRITRRFAAALPPSTRLSFGGTILLLTHGSPESAKEFPGGMTPEEQFCEIARKSNAKIIITGHRGLPSWREVCGVLIVDPGSIGTREEVVAPSYAILEAGPRGQLTVTHHEVMSGPAGGD